MARARSTPGQAAGVRRVVYLDDQGRKTDDPAKAVRGEVLEFGSHGRLRRRTRFFLKRQELPWVPVTEAAFLLWVFIGLFVVWLGIAVVLRLS